MNETDGSYFVRGKFLCLVFKPNSVYRYWKEVVSSQKNDTKVQYLYDIFKFPLLRAFGFPNTLFNNKIPKMHTRTLKIAGQKITEQKNN